MRKPEQKTNRGTGGLRARIGTKLLAGVATFSLVASMCPGAAALSYAGDQLVVGSAGLEAQASSTEPKPLKDWDTGYELYTGTWRVTEDLTIKKDVEGWSALYVKPGADVTLIIDKGATLDVEGGPCTAAIYLPYGSTLTIAGEGTLKAKGGDASTPEGEFLGAVESDELDDALRVGWGGHGGSGGTGAGAGIGTNGGAGGAGGLGGQSFICKKNVKSNIYGNEGKTGDPGRYANRPGTVLITGSVTVEATGGSAGKGGEGGARGRYVELRNTWNGIAAGTSGGGGGGGGGSAADGIGCGGTGGGGGGGGATGGIDGEFAFFGACDLDDLWGYGGKGGASAWGGGAGEDGDYGASNGGDSTDASKKYAKSGGWDGSCHEPGAEPFYIYKEPDATSGPKVTCTSGHGVTRSGTDLGTLQEFAAKGGNIKVVSSGTSTYDGKPHGVSVNNSGELSAQSADVSALRAQAADGEGYAESGTTTVDGVVVEYSVVYYGEAGNRLDSAPVMPGSYAAVVTFKCNDPDHADYNGSWVEPIVIAKRQVAKPTPAELTFVCADWNTGEGLEQEAFPGLDEANIEFVPDAETDDGSPSLKSAKDAGEYMACFKLKSPEIYEWADGTEGELAWVPWSIKLQEFDPNDVAYWGTAHDNETTTVDYTGEPIWVRPWYTYTKSVDGEFPNWYTHWGSTNRPTAARNSAAVLYVQGEDDEQGLVGYHTNEDGTFEPVTGAQVYAWANGVDVDGRHVDLESGEKVWYRTGADGWWEPLAVQDEEPEGADGFVVARDWAYVDRLGVMEPGTYQAYALFDEGAGFAPTALAEATVEVRAADAAPTKPAPAKASSSPKTGDLSPLAIGGLALAALLGAGALALSLARRRA